MNATPTTDFRKGINPGYPDIDAWVAEMETEADRIRAILPASEARIMGTGRGMVTKLVLERMIGPRAGAVTEGEIVVAGYTAGGAELYGLRG